MMSSPLINRSDIGLIDQVRIKYDVVIINYDPNRPELMAQDKQRAYISEILGDFKQPNYNIIFENLDYFCDFNLLYSPGMMVAEHLDMVPITNYNINKQNVRNLNAIIGFLGETVGFNLHQELMLNGFFSAITSSLIDSGEIFEPPDWYFPIENSPDFKFCYCEAKASINDNEDYHYSSVNLQNNFVKNLLRRRTIDGLLSAFSGFANVGLPDENSLKRNELMFISYVTMIDEYANGFNIINEQSSNLKYIELGRTLVTICKPIGFFAKNFFEKEGPVKAHKGEMKNNITKLKRDLKIDKILNELKSTHLVKYDVISNLITSANIGEVLRSIFKNRSVVLKSIRDEYDQIYEISRGIRLNRLK